MIAEAEEIIRFYSDNDFQAVTERMNDDMKEVLNAATLQYAKSQMKEDFGELLEYLASLRPRVRERVPEERRAGAFSRLFALCLEGGFPLEAEALEEVLGD